MNLAYLNSPDFSFFSDANKQLNYMIELLQSDTYLDSEHGEIEQYIQTEGFEVLRCLFQGYLDLKASNENTASNIVSYEGIALTHIKHNTKRKLTTLFGDVTVKLKSYSRQAQKALSYQMSS